jgi:hypothetical protein
MISSFLAALSGIVKNVIGKGVRLTAPITVPIVEKIKQLTGCRTHHVEDGTAFFVLVSVMAIAGTITDPWAWVETFAVFRSFQHACIAQRCEEKQAQELAQKGTASVACFFLLEVIFIQKEVLWLASFTHKEMWGALAGTLLFLAFYPWREVWREHHPLSD